MSNIQEAYIQTLRQIKDAEDSAEKETDARKNEVEEEIRNMQIQIEKLIEASKAGGENLVIKSIEESRRKALAEADSIVKEAQIKSKNISAQVNNETIQKIIGILLRGVE
jgi:vacuolar-type H+-ATPase subunit H